MSLHAFALLDRTCTPDLVFRSTNEILAHAIHEDYTHDMKRQGFTPETKPSMVSWEELPEDLKDSNRKAAEHIRIKLEAVGCDIGVNYDCNLPHFQFSQEAIELMAEMEHNRCNQ